jgi:pimeloyl-ACP methyl ester carboxylesterase
MYVEIGGIPQWIEIAPETDRPGAPVLLLIHGGPGGSTRGASASWRSWRRHFALVHWDQRGAGRTFARNGAAGSGPMNFEQFVSDAIEVAEFVRRELSGRDVVLLGHSWGSAIGVHMVKRRPDLFAAFVGTGQLVNFRRNEEANYEREIALARRSGNQAALAEEYFASLEAPAKRFVRFEGCHHFVHMNRPEQFLQALVAQLDSIGLSRSPAEGRNA